MAFIRLSDDYNDHPKIDKLSDGAFRLWHQTLGFCRKFKTDGLVPDSTVRRMKAYSAKRAQELSEPWRAGEQPLWHTVDGFGIRVHDYLEWNLSKEEEQTERTASAARMRKFRGRKSPNGYGVTHGVTNGVTEGVTGGVTNAFVPGRVSSTEIKNLEKKNVDARPSARSKRPIFTGSRVTVFEWMFDELCRLLGPHLDAFHIDEWFFELDAQCLLNHIIPPDRDNGAWLKRECLLEAQRRGLPLKIGSADDEADVWAELARKGPSVRP